MELIESFSELSCLLCGSANVRWQKTYKRGHRYVCNTCQFVFFVHKTPPVVATATEAESEYEKDVWDIRNLGAIGQEAAKITGHYKINFTDIHQPWLKDAAKKFTKYGLSTLAFRTTCGRLRDLRHFSNFLFKIYPSIQPPDINRQVVLDFLSYLLEQGLGGRSRQSAIYNIRVFFENCVRNEWLDIPKTLLIYQEDLPPREKHHPRFIPNEVIEQLNRHIDELPEPIMRMFLVIQECGMRIAELCLLKRDCISQDAVGDWWLTYHQYKMRKDHTIIISKELSGVIQEQQQYIVKKFDCDYPYLFCANGDNVEKGNATRLNIECANCMSTNCIRAGFNSCGSRRYRCKDCGISFSKKGIVDPAPPQEILEGGFIPVPRPPRAALLAEILNKLAEKHNICDLSGKLWRFQAHQFRHTVGTNMINRGVPIHIVSRFLGHETLGMTQVYATIHDPTLKKEIAKFYEKLVDVTGKVIEIDQTKEIESSDFQWFKRNIQAQALPNGYCALPVHMKECPHANACLSCSHFRTSIEFLDQHKAQIEQTEKILEKARENGWQRQIEMNERVANNLQKIIKAVEEE